MTSSIGQVRVRRVGFLPIRLHQIYILEIMYMSIQTLLMGIQGYEVYMGCHR